MKYAEPLLYADPKKAARRIVEIARIVEPVQDGRITGPMNPTVASVATNTARQLSPANQLLE